MANPFAPTGVKLRSELIAQAWQRKLVHEHKQDTIFQPMTGTIDNSKNMPVPGIVIEKNQEVGPGDDTLTIPFLRKLNNGPIIGDQDALGQEEKQTVRFFKVSFDDVQQAVAIKNKGLQAWRNKRYGFMEEAFPQLRMWWNEHMEVEHFNTFINGHSINLTDSDSQVGLSTALHPNQYTADVGKITTITAAGINSAIDALDTANTTMSLTLLDKVVLWAAQENMMPIKTSRGNMYAIFLHENAVFDLRTGASGEWNALMKDANNRGDANRGTANLLSVYRNLMLFEAVRAPTIDAIDSGNLITYNLPTVDNERPTLGGGDSNAVVNIVAGQGALCSVVAEDINFDEEFYSYRFTKGVDTHKLYGMARPDWVLETGEASDGLATTYNQSSFLLYTDSTAP